MRITARRSICARYYVDAVIRDAAMRVMAQRRAARCDVTLRYAMRGERAAL